MKPFGADMRIDIAEYDMGWQRVNETSFVMNDAFFNPHDFALTANFAVFFQVCLSYQLPAAPQCESTSCVIQAIVYFM